METVQQSGAIPHMRRSDQLEIFLITSRSSGNWIIPKGLVEPDMTPAESAANEVLEEAGLIGKIGDDVIETFQYKKWGRMCDVAVYDLNVTQILDEWDEMKTRERIIVCLDEAIDLIQDNMKPSLIAFRELQPR